VFDDVSYKVEKIVHVKLFFFDYDLEYWKDSCQSRLKQVLVVLKVEKLCQKLYESEGD
jgi:hypothetical protein